MVVNNVAFVYMMKLYNIFFIATILDFFGG
jgi:hypothetical protein